MREALPKLQSNRDLYAFVCVVYRRHDGSERTLEEYLRALWQLARQHRELAALPVARFGELLEAAMLAEAPPYDPAWVQAWQPAPDANDADEHRGDEGTGFAGWERVILRKIVDLRELRAAGAFEDEQRHFGLDSPRSGRWYNFAPLTFLECATAGTFDSGEATAEPDPDPVSDSDPDLVSDPDPDSDADPDAALLTEVSWDDFRTFLHKGQYYE